MLALLTQELVFIDWPSKQIICWDTCWGGLHVSAGLALTYVWPLLVGIKRSLAEEIWDFFIPCSPMHLYLFVESNEIPSWREWPLPEEKLGALSPDALIGRYLLFSKGHGGLMWHTWGLEGRSKCFKGKEMLEASSHGLMGWREAKWRWHYKRGLRMTWGKEWGKKLEDESKVW